MALSPVYKRVMKLVPPEYGKGGVATCLLCGALIFYDEEEDTSIHDRWHQDIVERTWEAYFRDDD